MLVIGDSDGDARLLLCELGRQGLLPICKFITYRISLLPTHKRVDSADGLNKALDE